MKTQYFIQDSVSLSRLLSKDPENKLVQVPQLYLYVHADAVQGGQGSTGLR